MLGSDLDLNSLQSTSRQSHFLLSAGSTHPNITEKLLTRFNSLPHFFPHCEIISMQRVFHFVLAWPRLSVQGKLLLLGTNFLCIISLLCSSSEPVKPAELVRGIPGTFSSAVMLMAHIKLLALLSEFMT